MSATRQSCFVASRLRDARFVASRLRGARRGFTLLEVMVAVAILAIGLSAVFSAEAGSVRTAQRARKMGLATMLVRCKMGEIEEDIAKKGLPAIYATETDKCCKDAEIDGFKCKWELQPIVLPDTMFGQDEDKDKKKTGTGTSGGLGSTGTGLGGLSGLASGKGFGSGSSPGLTGMLGAAAAAMGFQNGSNSTGSTDPNQDPNSLTKDPTKDPKDPNNKPKDPILKQDPKDVLGNDPSHYLQGGSGKEVDGITAMAMQFVYPVLKPAFQSQIRRLTVTVSWLEGQAPKSFDVTQYVVAEQPVNLTMDPNNPNQVLGGTSGTGTGATGTSTTGTGFTGSTPTTGTTGLGTH
jgi:general secretion pathway protein I